MRRLMWVGFSAPFSAREAVVERRVNRAEQSVSLILANGVVRTARRYGSQGCITHPLDHDGIHFEPSVVEPRVPDPATTAWPLGDMTGNGEVELSSAARAKRRNEPP